MVGLLAVLEMYRHLWLALAGVVTSLSYCRAAERVTRPHSQRSAVINMKRKRNLPEVTPVVILVMLNPNPIIIH